MSRELPRSCALLVALCFFILATALGVAIAMHVDLGVGSVEMVLRQYRREKMEEKRTARVWFRKEDDGDQDQLIATWNGFIIARGYSIPELNKKLGKDKKRWRLDFLAPIVTLVGPVAR